MEARPSSPLLRDSEDLPHLRDGDGDGDGDGDLEAPSHGASAGASVESTDGLIVEALNSLIQLDGVSQEESDFQRYRQTTKRLLEQLLVKLEENSEYERSLEQQIQQQEDRLEDAHHELSRNIEQFNGMIARLQVDHDLKLRDIQGQLEDEINRRLSLERLVLKLSKERTSLKNEVQLLRTADASLEKKSVRAYVADVISENGDLMERVNHLVAENERLRLQRNAELVSIMSAINIMSSKAAAAKRSGRIEL